MLTARFPLASVATTVQVIKSVNFVFAAKPVAFDVMLIEALCPAPRFVNTDIRGEDTAPLLVTNVLVSEYITLDFDVTYVASLAMAVDLTALSLAI